MPWIFLWSMIITVVESPVRSPTLLSFVSHEQELDIHGLEYPEFHAFWLENLDLAGLPLIGRVPNRQHSYFHALGQLDSTGKEHHNGMGELYEAAGLFRKNGDWEKAIAIYKQLREILETGGNNSNKSLVSVLNRMEDIYWENGEYQACLDVMSQALEIDRERLGRNHQSVLARLNNMAFIRAELGEYDRAIELYKEVLRIENLDIPKTETAITLNNLALMYFEKKELETGIGYLTQAMDIVDRFLPPNHLNRIEFANSMAVYHQETGNFKEALYWQKETVCIAMENMGENDPMLATCLDNLALIHAAMDEYAPALDASTRALNIRVMNFGKDHVTVGHSLANIGALFQSRGDIDQALRTTGAALVIFIKNLGQDHIKLVPIFNNLGTMFSEKENEEMALISHQEALRILVDTFGENHRALAGTYLNMGSLHLSAGRYNLAAPYLKQALVWMKETYSPLHPDLATCITNMAGLYGAISEPAKAIELLEEALSIKTKLLGPNHTDLSTIYNNLAGLYEETGQYRKVIASIGKAIVIMKSHWGDRNPDIIPLYNRLAIHAHRAGLWKEAEQMAEKARIIAEEHFGQNHLQVARCIEVLANFHYDRGDLPGGIQAVERALSIYEEWLDPDHREVTESLVNLATFCLEMGRLEEAEQYFRCGVATLEKNWESDLTSLAHPLSGLARTLGLQGRGHEALKIIRRALEIDWQTLDEVLWVSSERHKLAFIQRLSFRYDLLRNLVSQNAANETETIEFAFHALLQNKGVVLDALSRQRTALAHDPRARSLLEELRLLNAAIAATELNGGAVHEGDELEKIRNQKSELEQTLTRVIDVKTGNLMPEPNQPRLLDLLTDGSVLIEYAVYPVIDFQSGEIDGRRLEAFILRPDRQPNLIRVDLGSMDWIEPKIQEWRQWLLKESRNANSAGLIAAGQDLYNLIFAPLTPHLEGCDLILPAIDGPLGLIPFEALIDKQGRYLITQYRFCYQSSARDLFRLNNPKSIKTKALVAFGGPLYSASSSFSPGRPRSPFGDISFSRLPGSLKEVAEISTLFPPEEVEIFTAEKATEGNIKSVHSPGYLHIATHGFFFPFEGEPETVHSLGIRGAKSVSSMSGRPMMGIPIGDPLARSGLLFAGSENGGIEPGEDGFLTALEAADLHLQGTDLVVLSGCDTGLGDSYPGLGVFGLRRSFLQAGARTVVMSLWQVPDRETVPFMTHFYKKLKEGLTKSEALRHTMLDRLKNGGKMAHPLYWASFICTGEP